MQPEPSDLAALIGEHGEDASLLSVLERIQARFRYLPPEAMILVSERLGLPLSQVYSVATFYHAFSLKPRGEHLISVCQGTACHVRGSARVLAAVARALGIRPGETTPDRKFSLETVNCLGACALGPVLVIDGEYYGQMTPARVGSILAQYRDGEGRSAAP
ncbi:MAG: NAD(P)H-dependent oxidoreductase subunit E [Anaerolineae bacterium]|nr:NAD(P)H-dependent oxidoreductase subunit E [Anaerolineae bacterium]